MPVAAVAVIGSVVSAVASKKAAKKQSDAISQGSNAAISEQQRQYDQTRADQEPFRQAGVDALGRLNTAETSFKESPGYGFVRKEGTRDIGNTFAARGGAFSGNAMKALAEFNAGLASQEFGNWWNQQSDLAGIGQNSTNALGALGQRTADNVSSININAGSQLGDARASGVAGVGNSLVNLGDQLVGIREAKKPKSRAPYGQYYGYNPWKPGDGVRKPYGK